MRAFRQLAESQNFTVIKRLQQAAGAHNSFNGFWFFGHPQSAFKEATIARPFCVPHRGMQGSLLQSDLRVKSFKAKTVRSAFWNFAVNESFPLECLPSSPIVPVK
jgi:hypothetical protein